jgi:hypothetical protein
LLDADSDYDGEAGKAVIELVEKFAAQGHSGFSASLVLSAFDKVARFEPLTPLTSNPDEWMNISEASGGNPMWQSRRKPSVFSSDGGKTYYDLDEPSRPIHTTADTPL